MKRLAVVVIGIGVLALAFILAPHLSPGALDVIAGIVIGAIVTIVLSLLVIAFTGDRMGGPQATIDVYRAGLVDGARMAERLSSSRTLTIVQRRHLEIGEEVRHG